MYMTTPGLYTRSKPLMRQPMDRVLFANNRLGGTVLECDLRHHGCTAGGEEVEHRLAAIAPKPAQTAAIPGRPGRARSGRSDARKV